MRRHQEDEVGDREIAELAALADGSLAPELRAALEVLVAASSELAERLAEQERAVTLARSAAAEVSAPAGLRARVDAQRRQRRVQVPRRLVPAGAAIAVLAVAVAAGLSALGTSGEPFHAALASSGLAPGATGEATVTKTSSGWRIQLDAAGLPRLAGGRFYEAWLRNATGVLVPIGTFNEGRKITMWAGVSPTVFPTLTVTREQADGDQSSSGEKVLVGTIVRGG